MNEKLQRIIRDILELPELVLSDDDSVETLTKWDSLATVQIITAVVEEFGIEIDIDDFEHFTSVKGILKVLSSGNENK